MKKNNRKTRIMTIRSGASPTPERRLQNGGVVAEAIDRDDTNRVMMRRFRAVWDCPLDIYVSRGIVTYAEYRAGMKFRSAYFRTALGIAVEDIGGGSSGDREMGLLIPLFSERVLREAYGVLSPSQKAIIVQVCGHDQAAGETARMRTLHRGLERLCDLWAIHGLGNDGSEQNINYTNNEKYFN